MEKIISTLFKKYGLGNITENILPVSGGLLHKMYKVQATSGCYAVKCLNPEIMSRPGVFDNYAVAEKLEKILEEREISIVPAISFDGKKMIEEDGRYFYIFHWQNGKITDFENITSKQCYKAGEILGQIHAIDSQTVDPGEPELIRIDFEDYLKIARDNGSSIYDLIKENRDMLEYAQNELNSARKKLPSMKSISNDDMDPKNIMWDGDNAYVIDLECLSYSNPIEVCLDLSLQWSGTVNEKFCPENLAAFYEGYLKNYDNGFRAYADLYGISYKWLEWLEYNIKRMLGLTGQSNDEIALGEAETVKTISIIRYLYSLEEDICNVLNQLK